MMSRVVVIGLVCVAGVFFVLSSATGDNVSQHAGVAGETLPASLDQYYPPQSPAPAYRLAMLELNRFLTSTVCDLEENDIENAQANFASFKKAYSANSAMVPEWTERYPAGPIAHLESVLTTGDPSKVMPAVEAVGAVCHTCHLTAMAGVQQKYRWGRFADITVTDPVSQHDVSYAQLMLMLQTNLDGIGNDLAQGQTEGAIRQLAGFQARFQAMSEACVSCHETERLYYVSADITDLFADLQAELAKPAADPGVVGKLLQTIGEESCSKCHLVHIPAAYGQQLRGFHLHP